MASIWHALPGHALECHAWNDEFVFYNGLSGMTHILGPLAAQMIFLLQESSLDSLSLVNSLTLNSESPVEADDLQQVEEILSELHSLALIERS
ncbi:MAG: HPr-rel-A system PqqD family peptide chaperone [Pseudomonadota bacterium]